MTEMVEAAAHMQMVAMASRVGAQSTLHHLWLHSPCDEDSSEWPLDLRLWALYGALSYGRSMPADSADGTWRPRAEDLQADCAFVTLLHTAPEWRACPAQVREAALNVRASAARQLALLHLAEPDMHSAQQAVERHLPRKGAGDGAADEVHADMARLCAELRASPPAQHSPPASHSPDDLLLEDTCAEQRWGTQAQSAWGTQALHGWGTQAPHPLGTEALAPVSSAGGSEDNPAARVGSSPVELPALREYAQKHPAEEHSRAAASMLHAVRPHMPMLELEALAVRSLADESPAPMRPSSTAGLSRRLRAKLPWSHMV